ncbi:unnamed protein product [Arabis nemorensis]|uniref:Zinc knuckle CX2CX4HX4C domain-containing protein n=1 Tax=Arabis nemorensis TaxID=586526 RepID=A0A565AXZ9_9BRAS|nr:unnamed protein product [Arabis nemorensis]
MSHRYSRAEKGKGLASTSTCVREEPIRFPEIDHSVLIEANKLTLIGRVLNPDMTKPKAVLAFLPTLWPTAGQISGKVQVEINALLPLVTRRSIQFSSGEDIWIEFEYESLHKHCFLCMRLDHEEQECGSAN